MPLGYSVCFEGNYGSNILGLDYPDAAEPDGKKANVWFIDGPPPYSGPAATSGCHLAWRASSRAQVDAIYQEARTTERPACARTTTPITTAPS